MLMLQLLWLWDVKTIVCGIYKFQSKETISVEVCKDVSLGNINGEHCFL